MTNLVIYDLDGTLIDSAAVVMSILNQMREEIGKQPIAKSDLVPWMSLGGEALIIKALEVGVGDASIYLDDFRARYLMVPTPSSAVYPGVHETLNELLEMEISLAVCTNKPRRLAEKVLEETRLLDKFSFMSAGGDLPTQKPNPKNLAICLDYFGSPPNKAILVGDSTVDQAISLSLGIPFAHYLSGYDDGVSNGKIDYKIKHHSDLIKCINVVKAN